MKNFAFSRRMGLAILAMAASINFAYALDEPPLPLGLGVESSAPSSEPELPPGLETPGASEEPSLPAGLGETAAPQKSGSSRKASLSWLPFDLTGYLEGRVGFRTQRDPYEKDASIGETRLQLKTEKGWDRATFKFTGDIYYDPVLDEHRVQLEKGAGFFDLREASILFRATDFMDLKAGRQILTWGTGDMIFINDLFPKDWNSFFIGRDTEYLKAPSDSIKVSFFTNLFNIDVAYTPRFDHDRFIDGSRISFFNASLGRRSGMDSLVQIDERTRWFEEDEIAWRLYRNIVGYELALYGYQGYWKSPAGMNALKGKAIFPPLSVYGASVRGAVFQGIGNIEVGYYDSRKDRKGDDPFVRNGEVRFLGGYEREIAANFIVGLQYYLEFMLDHGQYRLSQPSGSMIADDDRHLITLRLTQLLMNQNLNLSLFTFFSPSDEDAYFRPKVHYKIDDRWSAEIGGNIFVGARKHTFFSQFEKNTNVYTGVRYGF